MFEGSTRLRHNKNALAFLRHLRSLVGLLFRRSPLRRAGVATGGAHLPSRFPVQRAAGAGLGLRHRPKHIHTPPTIAARHARRRALGHGDR